ncbi:MAG: hypothetical protein ABSG17_06415 [Spirochaetia bacterium]|jgi:hypothetical protein
MSNKLAIHEFLTNGSQEIDLDLVKKLIVHPVLKPDFMLGNIGKKEPRHITGVAVSRIEWWDKTKETPVISSVNIVGTPKQIIHQLVKYKRSHKIDFFSELDRRGIVITTIEEEQQKKIELARETAQILAQGALNGIAAKKAADDAFRVAKDAKPRRHYVAESIIIACVLAAFGLFMWINPSLTPLFLPAEIAIVILVVLFYGKLEEWVHTFFHGKKKEGQ